MMRQQLPGLRLGVLDIGQGLVELADSAARFGNARLGRMVDGGEL